MVHKQRAISSTGKYCANDGIQRYGAILSDKDPLLHASTRIDKEWWRDWREQKSLKEVTKKWQTRSSSYLKCWCTLVRVHLQCLWLNISPLRLLTSSTARLWQAWILLQIRNLLFACKGPTMCLVVWEATLLYIDPTNWRRGKRICNGHGNLFGWRARQKAGQVARMNLRDGCNRCQPADSGRNGDQPENFRSNFWVLQKLKVHGSQLIIYEKTCSSGSISCCAIKLRP